MQEKTSDNSGNLLTVKKARRRSAGTARRWIPTNQGQESTESGPVLDARGGFDHSSHGGRRQRLRAARGPTCGFLKTSYFSARS